MDAIFTAALEHLAGAAARLSFTKMSERKVLSEFGKDVDAFVEAVGELGYPIQQERAGDPQTKVALLRAYVEYFKVVEAVKLKASARACEELKDDYDLTREEFFLDYMEPLLTNPGFEVPTEAFFRAFVKECRRSTAAVFREFFTELPAEDDPENTEMRTTRPPSNAPLELTREANDTTPAYDDPTLSNLQKRMFFIKNIVN